MSTKIKVSKLEIVGFFVAVWRSSAAVEIDQMCLHVGGGTGETVEEGAESSWRGVERRRTGLTGAAERHTLEALWPCDVRSPEQLPRVIAESLSAGFPRYLKCEHVNHTKTETRGLWWTGAQSAKANDRQTRVRDGSSDTLCYLA